MPLAPGQGFGAFEIVSRLGAGGMGEVWRARDERLERDVALKVLPAAAVADDIARARLVREARMASKLNHPNVCTIYEVGEAEGQAYIAMELVAGQALSDRLAAGRLSQEQVIRLGQQIADALSHAHEHSVVHRDLKSANVIVTPEGRAKVLDFGLAKPLLGKELEAATTLTQASLTEAGAVVGTLAYMAPEQLRGRAADARSDVWALGVVLYEMAGGRRPFAGDTGFELSSAILNQPPRALPAGVPQPLGTIIERCLAKEPSQRYQRAGEVRSALEALQTGSTPAAWPGWRAMLVAHRWPVVLAVASSVLVVVAGLDVGGLRSRFLGGSNGRSIRMAVLPFANLSGDPEQEYLSDGLTQEMISQLGRLHPGSLSVIARTSVMQYKKSETPIDQIGRELGVEYVLEGSAQREGSRIRITAELIRVGNQTQLWGDIFEREMSGILALQSDVARKVAESLALKLLPAEQARLAGAKTVDPEVYELCLKGNYHLGRMTAADFDTAEEYFQRALAKDPASAAAYAGMANVWVGRRQIIGAPAAEAGQKARAAALKAIELDDSLAESHLSLANVLAWTDLNFPDAEREYKRALELDPGNQGARCTYGHFLMMLGRPDEALPQIERAVALDPLDVGNRLLFASDLILARRYDQALGQANEVLRRQPGNFLASAMVFLAQHLKQRHADAIAAAVNYYASAGWGDVAEALKQSYAESGYAGALRRAAEVELTKYGSVAVWDAACNYAMAGDLARSLDLLERAYEDREPNLPFIGCLPIFDGLRSEPRFQALLRKMNLPVAPPGTPRPTGATS